jgi:hypothetical protein
MHLAARRRVDDADFGRAVADQRDVDGEVRSAADEFARAVERVDQDEAVAECIRDRARGDLLLGDAGNAGEFAAQAFQDQAVTGD